MSEICGVTKYCPPGQCIVPRHLIQKQLIGLLAVFALAHVLAMGPPLNATPWWDMISAYAAYSRVGWLFRGIILWVAALLLLTAKDIWKAWRPIGWTMLPGRIAIGMVGLASLPMAGIAVFPTFIAKWEIAAWNDRQHWYHVMHENSRGAAILMLLLAMGILGGCFLRESRTRWLGKASLVCAVAMVASFMLMGFTVNFGGCGLFQRIGFLCALAWVYLLAGYAHASEAEQRESAFAPRAN